MRSSVQKVMEFHTVVGNTQNITITHIIHSITQCTERISDKIGNPLHRTLFRLEEDASRVLNKVCMNS